MKTGSIEKAAGYWIRSVDQETHLCIRQETIHAVGETLTRRRQLAWRMVTSLTVSRESRRDENSNRYLDFEAIDLYLQLDIYKFLFEFGGAAIPNPLDAHFREYY